ncbi:MAG: toprim domain-containing protein, partial [Candidatus Kariarchaeaceae archaeon]
PQFEGQTKTKLGNSEVRTIVSNALRAPLKRFLDNNQALGKAIINKAILARRAREAAKKAKDLIRKKGSGRRLPGKLVASREKDPLKRELYLVEGQSAGGTAVKARDAGFQEVLFLRGKVLNVEKARLNRALENQEIRNIITAIGTGIQDECDVENCRYGKIILLMDADVDGAHIATLLFTFFYRYLRPVIEAGRLYIARPPLFKLTGKGDAKVLFKVPKTEEGAEEDGKRKKKKVEKDYLYLTKDSDLDEWMYALDAMDIDRKLVTINRFKGLGEMNANQLEETTMALKSRQIARVNIDDAVLSEQWLTKLMGDDVEDRKKFIQDEVFSDTGDSTRGEFYNIGFQNDVDDSDRILSKDEQEIVDQEVDSGLDEYFPFDDLLSELEDLDF